MTRCPQLNTKRAAYTASDTGVRSWPYPCATSSTVYGGVTPQPPAPASAWVHAPPDTGYAAEGDVEIGERVSQVAPVAMQAPDVVSSGTAGDTRLPAGARRCPLKLGLPFAHLMYGAGVRRAPLQAYMRTFGSLDRRYWSLVEVEASS